MTDVLGVMIRGAERPTAGDGGRTVSRADVAGPDGRE